MATSNVTLPGTGEVVSTDVLTTLNGAGIATGEEAQRMKVAWGVVGTGTDTDATHPFPISTNASIFRFSTNNTSSAELAASATFTGVLETALDQPSISILLTSDQPITLKVRQFIDAGGLYEVAPIVYYVAANQQLSASFALNGNYVQVTAQNTGTATTTTFELNTAYGSLPSSDGSGRMPVSKADCIQVLNTTITVAGISSSIDTMGYGAIIVQISGVWQGYAYFEASNDGLVWDTVLVFSRDSLSLQDIVTSGGLYTIRPSGRYLHLVVTNITGTMAINAQGRAAEGVSASDLLSLAMDKQNNTPLYVETNHKKDASGALILSDGAYPLYGTGNAVGQIGPVIDTLGYSTLCMTVSGAVFTGVVESSNDPNSSTWQIATGVISSQSFGGNGVAISLSSMTMTAATSGGANLTMATPQGRYFRLRASSYTSGVVTYIAYLRNGPAPVGLITSQAVAATVTGYPTAAAAADALANPTVTQIGADGMRFNGTTWDRERNNWNTTTGDTGAKTVSVAGATQTNYNAAGATIVINMGTVSGTTPTLTAQVQGSADGGTTWYNIAGAVTPTINATGQTVLTVYPGVAAVANAAVSSVLPRTWRLNYTLGGTTPSFTITNVQVAYNN
jgi:hypothetical protein